MLPFANCATPVTTANFRSSLLSSAWDNTASTRVDISFDHGLSREPLSGSSYSSMRRMGFLPKIRCTLLISMRNASETWISGTLSVIIASIEERAFGGSSERSFPDRLSLHHTDSL